MRRVPSPKLELFTAPGFLPPDLCDRLIALIDTDRRPSTIADPNGDDYFRTSETCDLDSRRTRGAGARALLFALNGIDPAHGEPVQGQRYEVGQEFKAHTDYFEPHGRGFREVLLGRRPAHMDLHDLSQRRRGRRRDALQGDRTRPSSPKPGKLVCWNNRRPDGSCNAATLHHAMKVRKGVKYVITKWYRERPWG